MFHTLQRWRVLWHWPFIFIASAEAVSKSFLPCIMPQTLHCHSSKRNPQHHVSLKVQVLCMDTSLQEEKKADFTNTWGNLIDTTINKTQNTPGCTF